jgi:hypothetical protein
LNIQNHNGSDTEQEKSDSDIENNNGPTRADLNTENQNGSDSIQFSVSDTQGYDLIVENKNVGDTNQKISDSNIEKNNDSKLNEENQIIAESIQ